MRQRLDQYGKVTERIAWWLILLGVLIIIGGRLFAQAPQKRAFLSLILRGDAPTTSTTVVTTTTTTSSTTTSTIGANTPLVVVPTQYSFHVSQEPDPLIIHLIGSGMQSPMLLFMSGTTPGYFPMKVTSQNAASVEVPRAMLLQMILDADPVVGLPSFVHIVCYAQRGEWTSEFTLVSFEF